MESTKVKGYRFLAFVQGLGIGLFGGEENCFLLGEAKNIFLLEKRGWSYYLLFVVCCCGGGGWWWRLCSWWGIRSIRNLAHGEPFCTPTAHSKFICEVFWPLSPELVKCFFFNSGKPEQPTILVILSAFFRLEGTGKVWQNVSSEKRKLWLLTPRRNGSEIRSFSAEDLPFWEAGKIFIIDHSGKRILLWRNTPTQTYFAWERQSNFQNASYSSLQ